MREAVDISAITSDYTHTHTHTHVTPLASSSGGLTHHLAALGRVLRGVEGEAKGEGVRGGVSLDIGQQVHSCLPEQLGPLLLLLLVLGQQLQERYYRKNTQQKGLGGCLS